MYNPKLKLAEYVLPGHSDKICDAIADGIVDAAVAVDPDAVVAVEVKVHRDRVFVDGHVTTGNGFTEDCVREAVRSTFIKLGYDLLWPPDVDQLNIDTDLVLTTMTDNVREAQRASCDQNVVVGYACRDERTNYLPLEHFLVWQLARRLDRLRADRLDLSLGPDGKVLIAADECDGEFYVRSVNFSVQHGAKTDPVALTRALRGLAVSAFSEINDKYALNISVDEKSLRLAINGGGEFLRGGPYGDNGLSGKKLVMDAWGPAAPIGGGALSGKDPHSVDRAGALRARQIAREIVSLGLAEDAQVMLSFFPGEIEPVHFGILVNGKQLAPRAVDQWRKKHDLTIAGTNEELCLKSILWQPLASWGHFTRASLPWEGGIG